MSGPLNNINEETGSNGGSRMPSELAPQGATDLSSEYNHGSPRSESLYPRSPRMSVKATRKRGNSSVSRVDLEFFDPAGVQELRRTITEHNEDNVLTSSISRSTEETLHPKGDQPFDLEKFTRLVVRRRDEANIKPRSLGIVFRNLNVVGVTSADSFLPTLGSVLNPVVMLEKIQKSRHPTIRNILSGFEGVIKPGEMLLVLGSPGSGCSTLLKTLANQRKEYHSVDGEVFYDSITPDDLQKHFRGDVQYCPEDDIHFPTLSVEQTVSFAAASRTPRDRIAESRKGFATLMTKMLATIFGLRHAMATPVGDASIRGVSGGEKKRVSIAEALASRGCIGAWDNSTRGLDASTALEFVRALRIATDSFDMTTIVSIYQAGESLYNHFDKVCVIYEGRMAYFGHADQAKQYFLDMGYEPANRQTTADFLVAVTDPSARIRRAGFSNQPRTAAEFAEYFLASEHGKANGREMQEYLDNFVGKPDRKSAYIESAHAEWAKRSRKDSPFLLSISQQAKVVMRRRVQIILGNKVGTGMNLISFIFQGIIMGTVFFNSPEATSAYFSRGGVLFFALLFAALTTMAEIPALYSQRPIVLRHNKAALYRPFVEALALTLVDIPISFITMSVFGIIVYFMVGLQRTASQFFIFLLFLFTMTIAMKAWFRGIAAAFASEAAAQSFAGISVLVFSIYTGYTIPKPSMIGALRWITYINPIKYGFEAIMANEFHTLNGTCSNLVPQGPGYENVSLVNQVCTTVGSLPAQATVDGSRFLELSYGFKYSHLWMNYGIVVAYGALFFFALLFFTEFNTSTSTDTLVTQFKRGSKHSKTIKSANDEEKVTAVEEKGFSTSSARPSGVSTTAAPRMTDVFSWRHVNYVVPIPGKANRQLLSDVSGFVAPGKMTALMGESGAGKTTLLNVLAMRTDTGVVTGDRLVNGQPLPADFQSQSAYCQQMDTHVPFSTVREALLFSAKLRQPPEVPLAEKEAYVDKCLEMCGLVDYADASVGSLSIEHKKRTTIGVELAAKPKLLLFLDEPTSGLDSQSAWAIISFLRTLADNGQAILCTIHQPSAELFQSFDRMLLLKKGGQTVYFGDLGQNATTLIQYFENNGARACLPSENPAEYMLDVIGAGATATSQQDWHQIWQSSPEFKRVQDDIEVIHTEGRNRPAVGATIKTEFATSWTYQVWELLKRNSDAHWRNPNYLMAKLILNVFGGLFIGFTFFRAKDTQQGTQNKLFAIFMATILSVPLSNQIQVPFINMRKTYEIRERPSRMYSWTALLTSQILIELPWNILGSSLLFFCWYWTVGFENSRAGYTYLMIGLVYPFYYLTFAQAVASMAPSAELAALLFSFLFSFVLTFNGVLQPFRQLGWWRWMYRLSPYTYLIEGLAGQAIGRQVVNCSAVELVTINPPPNLTCEQYMTPFINAAGGYLTNPAATSACEFCSIRTTDQFLGNAFNIMYEHHWRNLGIVIGFGFFNVMLVFLMTYIFRIHKGSFLPAFLRKN